ncbi:tetratricopeptide repeat protein [Streptomyces sp. NPDC093568]|uniref:tetratricopeptide repeat protein n=1 Tax=Streptomyces sp. NPDC093568 TaxID=3366041 RepID=UPI0037F4E6F9
MPDYPHPAHKSPLAREALQASTRRGSIRVIEHALWEARGLRLFDYPEDLVVGLEWLGLLYLLEARPARAEPSLKDALKCRRRQLGVDHPQVRYLLALLTDAYEEQGKPVKAIPRLEQRLAADLPHGTAARRTVRSRSKLFGAYWSAGRIQDAFGLYRDALASCERTYGPDAPESVDLRHQLAWTYLDAELPEGIPLLERNITALQRADCPRPLLAFRRGELGMVYIWWGRASDAMNTIRQGIDDIAGLNNNEARLVHRNLLRHVRDAQLLEMHQRPASPSSDP